MDQGKILITAGIYGFLAVALGAFGSHSLKAVLDPASLQIFEVAVKYQMYHGLALGFIAALAQPALSKHLKRAAILFSCGIFIFSGSLYALIATQVRILGAITPLGGGLLLLGWFFLICEGWERSQKT